MATKKFAKYILPKGRKIKAFATLIFLPFMRIYLLDLFKGIDVSCDYRLDAEAELHMALGEVIVGLLGGNAVAGAQSVVAVVKAYDGLFKGLKLPIVVSLVELLIGKVERLEAELASLASGGKEQAVAVLIRNGCQRVP